MREASRINGRSFNIYGSFLLTLPKKLFYVNKSFAL